MDFGSYLEIAGPFDGVVDRVVEALKTEGFGVLSDIDMQKAMREKLGEEIPAYRILGACNPPLAYRAIQTEPNVGLLLPCNITIRDLGEEKVLVGFLNPDLMVELTNNPLMNDIATDASSRLRRVRDRLAAN